MPHGGEWHSLAIEVDDSIVGHLMWAIDEKEDSVWLGGLVIDRSAQGRGYGRAAVTAFLDRFTEGGKINAALSYSTENTVARRLYNRIGFEKRESSKVLRSSPAISEAENNRTGIDPPDIAHLTEMSRGYLRLSLAVGFAALALWNA